MMNKIFPLSILCLALSLGLHAQQPHYGQVLRDFEAKSPMLHAAATQAEADREAVHVGALLPNPEVEAGYYWGDPSENGKRWDLSVQQSFEMPSVLIGRARLRTLHDSAATLQYLTLRNAALLEVQMLCADMVYYRNVADIYNRRCNAAHRLAQLYRQRYEAGDCSIIDYNRAQMYLSEQMHKSAEANLQVDHAVHDLCQLMNDDAYNFVQYEYEPVQVEPSFEDWYAQIEMRNPTLRLADNQLLVSQQQEQVSRASWLPDMSVGYASENIVGETWKGVTVGLSLPIWSQQRAVKAARMQTAAAQESLTAQRVSLASRLRCMFHRHEALIRLVDNLKDAFEQHNSTDLITRALEAGEINLEQYLQQIDYYNDIELQLWEASRELERLHLQLYAIAL